jgi:hypothetical protein
MIVDLPSKDKPPVGIEEDVYANMLPTDPIVFCKN